jgi:hypothetical protein
MNQIIKKKLKRIILERIQRIQAQKNPKDSKYPLTITAIVLPTSVSNFNKSHKSHSSLTKAYMRGNVPHLLRKRVKFQGDYAKRGNTGVNTLRLKVKRSDWPDEWSFPETELERRLFLQNFRLSNLDMLTPFDEGGKKYKELFPPVAEIPIEVDFEDEETPESFEEEITPGQESPSQSNEDLIFEALEALDYLAGEAREYGEPDFAASISEVYMILLREALKNKKKR